MMKTCYSSMSNRSKPTATAITTPSTIFRLSQLP